VKRERACGVNAVDSLIRHAPERIVRVWVAGGERAQRVAEAARGHGIAVERARPDALGKLAGGVPHQGIVAEFRPRAARGEPELHERVAAAGDDALVLVLDQVQDPHNLGACLRSAAAAGATAVVLPRDRAAGLTAAVRRAAAGAAEIVPVVEVANLARTLRALRDAGVWCTGLAGEAAATVYEIDFGAPAALVLGGEAEGLRRLTRERCDTLARIPISGDVESLNVSVAAAIALFEVRRQRGSA
jgi:23S rRNA (guanosine2251-2'-O)-methyltransferase